MVTPKYALFYDFHNSWHYPAVGKYFCAEKFTEAIQSCGVDYLVFHARCNMGTCYYDSQFGIKHPSLQRDLFGELAAACQKRNIALSAYFNAELSFAEALAHPDWCLIYPDGKIYSDQRFSPYLRRMCFNSPYRQHLLDMIHEVAILYPVTGFFIDGLQATPCICPYCIAKMQKSGIDWQDAESRKGFSKNTLKELIHDIALTARSVNPDFLLYYNPVDYFLQSEDGSYLECECIPSRSDWGYEYLPVLSHYMRTLGKKNCLNLSARFYSWGDFGGVRPEVAIRSELLYGLANGLRPNIGDHFHPDGRHNLVVLNFIGKIYRYLQARENWYEDAIPFAEVAIVYPETLEKIRVAPELRGAVRMLSELQLQFDIVDLHSSWEKYPLLIFPDNIRFSQEISRRVQEHLNRGGFVISSATAGLLQNQLDYLPSWPVDYQGDCPFEPAYFSTQRDLCAEDDILAMPMALYSSGVLLRQRPGSKVLAWLHRSHRNFGWDGIYPEYYNPPEPERQAPCLASNKQCVHFSHALFTGYKRYAANHLREIFSMAVAQLWKRPKLLFKSPPSFLRSFVTCQPHRFMIHLLAHIPEQRGTEAAIIEDDLLVKNLRFSFRLDNFCPTQAYLAPERQALKMEKDDDHGYISIQVPEFAGYALVVLEE